jgi:hypothetical protein
MANEQTSVPLYAAAEILTAANMNISAGTGVPVFATTVTRDAAFGGANEKTLAEGQLCYLSASNIVQYYDGAAWATVGPAAASALTLTGSSDPSAVATVSINNCFSATYQNYLMTYDLVQSTAAILKLRLRVGGTDSSTGYSTSYIYQELAGAATAKVSTGAANEAQIMQSAGSLTTIGQMFVQRPFEAIATGAQMHHLGEGTPPGYYFSGGWVHSVTTSFDGLTVFPNSGTITGKIRVYGLALS